MRETYEVRVREKIGRFPFSVKKSKFYEASSPGEAAGCYKGPGFVMWSRSVKKDKKLGATDFFKLGDSLLKDLQIAGGEDTDLSLVRYQHDKKKDRKIKRRGYNARTNPGEEASH